MRSLLLFFPALPTGLVDARLMRRSLAATWHSDQPQVSPQLDPKSSEKFFGKDYPHDMAPKSGPKFEFDHPYPGVQNDDHFDKDYVKDENNDGGDWEAQMTYDYLRTKVQNAETAVGMAKQNAEMKRKEYEAAQAAADSAAGKVSGAPGSSPIESAISDVESGTAHLQDCIKELQVAKAKLEALAAGAKEEDKLHHDVGDARAELDEAEKQLDKERAELKTAEEGAKESSERLEQKRGDAEKPSTASTHSGAISSRTGVCAWLATLVALIVFPVVHP